MSIVKEDLAAVSPDALAPAATEAKAESIGVTKAAMPGAKCFVSAMLAGAFIGFGGMYFCTFLGDTTMAFGVQRLVGGLCFCLGLCLVLCCGAELFTGNVLMVCAKASKKITFGGLFRNWGIVWVGNLAGSLLAMFIIFMSNLQGMNGGAVGEAFVSVAAGKVSLAPEVLFFPMGLVLNGLGFGAAGAVTLGGVAYNLVLATLGNIVGGLLVGLAYWFIYHKKQEK